MARRGGGGCVRVAILVIAVPIVFGLGVLLVSNLNRVANHETTTGVVVDLIPGTDSDGDVTYTPVYEYTVNGSTYRYESAVSYGGLLVPEFGDTRTILYDPGDPTDARIRNTFVLIWLPIILMIVPVLIVIGIFWAMRRRQRVADQAPPWSDQIPAQQPEWTGQPPWQAPSPDDAGTPSETVEATFMGTEPSQMDDQGRVRYRVKARIEVDGVIHRFRSDWVDEDPTLYYMQHGNKVEVRVDPTDLTHYEVVLPPVE